nr:hypothetical protein [Tanacetum cinerariifolium]
MSILLSQYCMDGCAYTARPISWSLRQSDIGDGTIIIFISLEVRILLRDPFIVIPIIITDSSRTKEIPGTSELIADTKTECDESKEGTKSESEEAASEDRQQQAIPAKDIAEAEPLVRSSIQSSSSPVQTATSSDWFPESLPISPIAPSPPATPVPAVALDESGLLEIRAQLELHRSILYTHTQRLDALPPTRFNGYG